MNRLASRLALNVSRRAVRTPAPFLRTMQARNAHYRVAPPYNVENGMGEFLPPASLKMIAEDYQQGLLDRLNDEVKDTPQANMSVAQTVIDAAQDPSKALIFNYASEALNNSFFLQCLSPPPEGKTSNEDEITQYMGVRIRTDFGDLAQLKSTFSAVAMGMFGSGWVWLVCDQTGSLAVLPTFGTGTLLIRSRERLQKKLNVPEAVIGEEVATSRKPTIPNASASSPISGASHPASPTHPPQTREFSLSAMSRNTVSNFTAQSLLGGAPYEQAQASDVSHGERLFPLLCLSVHEHAWVSAGYGVWGKEEYLKRFWSVVNWKQVSDHMVKYVPDKSKFK